MASAGCSLVLRVKRKRKDDPANALVVLSKRRRLHQDVEAAAAAACGEHVFEFCGTLPDQHENCASAVMHLISSKKAAERKSLKESAFARLSISHHKDQQRALKKVSASSQRYSLVAKRRCMPDFDRSGTSASNCDQASERLSGLVHMYEVVQESDDSMGKSEGKEPLSTSNGFLPHSQGAVTCNSTVMTREKVNVKPPEGFVYDIYYSERSTVPDPDILDWDSLSVCEEWPMYVHDVITSDDEHAESEEDSNDESHWKNDYPEEEDWSGDSASHSLDSLEDPSSNPVNSFRHREPYFDELDPFEDDPDCHRLCLWQDSDEERSCDVDSLDEEMS